MKRFTRIFSTAALTAALLLIAVASASANRFGNDDRNINIKWSPLELISGGTTTRCNITMLGTFHSSTITKSLGALVGHITHSNINDASCNEGAHATILAASLPWHVTYGGFRGTLPAISGLLFNIVGLAMRIDPAGALPACLFRSETGEPFRGIANVAGGAVTGLTADATASIDLEDESFACSIGGDLEFQGTGAVEDKSSNALNVRLI